MNDRLQSQPARALRREAAIAAAWGFAEATFFFIVPDVFTSRVVLHSPRRGLTACIWAVGGALLGGTLVFALARGGFSPQLAAGFALLPGINAALETTAATLLAQHGLGALFLGAASGIPYKLLAVEAARADTPFVTFVLVSAAARLARFLAVTELSGALGATVFRKCSARTKLAVHAVGWTVFYAGYFWAMRSR